jgi:hypothetical protein
MARDGIEPPHTRILRASEQSVHNHRELLTLLQQQLTSPRPVSPELLESVESALDKSPYSGRMPSAGSVFAHQGIRRRFSVGAKSTTSLHMEAP